MIGKSLQSSGSPKAKLRFEILSGSHHFSDLHSQGTGSSLINIEHNFWDLLMREPRKDFLSPLSP